MFTPDESSLIINALMAYGIEKSNIYDKLYAMNDGLFAENKPGGLLETMSLNELSIAKSILEDRIQKHYEWSRAYQYIDLEKHIARTKEANDDPKIKSYGEKLNRINERIENIINSI